MQNMSLQGSAEEDPREALKAGSQFAQKSLFSDSFFSKLIEKELPSAAFCQTKGSDTAAKVQLTDFFVDVARELSKNTSEKAKHEFIVICMLNALFGNPCIHLV